MTQPYHLEGFEDLELSTQILLREAFRRKLNVEILDRSAQFVRLRKGNHVEYVKMATMTSKDSLASYLIMENKAVTKHILAEYGLLVPWGQICLPAGQAGKSDCAKLPGRLQKSKIVVKPNSTNHGLAVSILDPKFSLSDFQRALDNAFQYDSSVIVEEFIEGVEYRFLVIAGKVRAIVHRVPANVVGDGVKTVRQLVEEKNQHPYRGNGFNHPLQCIQMGKIEGLVLAEQGLSVNSVPPKGAQIFLRKNSNVGTGGDSIDSTDVVHDSYKHIAEEAVRAVGAQISGVDMIIKSCAEPAAATDDSYAILELNFNPAIHMHAYPYQGKSRDVSGIILDFLGF